MVKSQELLDKEYPKNERGEITELKLFNKGLETPLYLSDFVNLQELNLGFNPLLTGPLNFLEKLEKLTKLYIGFTDFDSILEHLPPNLEKIYCLGTKVEGEFKNYQMLDGYYDYQAWRKDKIEEVKQEIIGLENLVRRKFCANFKKSLNFDKGIINFVREKQQEINELREQSRKYYKAEIEFDK